MDLNYTDILSCANGSLGNDLLAKYGEEMDALDPPSAGLPHIVFNGVFVNDLKNRAQENLLPTVCLVLQIRSRTTYPTQDFCLNVVIV